MADLSVLNLNLPSRVVLPVHEKDHHVVRIPQNQAVVLNSKEKAPYLIYVEVIECDDIHVAPVPCKLLESSTLRHVHSQEDFASSAQLSSGADSNNSAERSPRAEPCIINASTTYVIGCEFDDPDCWSQEEDDIIQQFNMKSKPSVDTLSQFSVDSATSVDTRDQPLYVAAGDIRRRLSENLAAPKKKFDVNI
jgi:hypothetical protein